LSIEDLSGNSTFNGKALAHSHRKTGGFARKNLSDLNHGKNQKSPYRMPD
jgi:hypothetical protein